MLEQQTSERCAFLLRFELTSLQLSDTLDEPLDVTTQALQFPLGAS